MFKTTDEFYKENWPATLYVSAAAFAVWLIILSCIAAV